MDDFLHNLRSGKLKHDRSRRDYNGPQRRNANDRRKRDHGNKEAAERMNAIKELLENIAETQSQMADAYMARCQAEERKATAMEKIALSLTHMLPEQVQLDIAATFEKQLPAAPSTEPTAEDKAPAAGGKLDSAGQKVVLKLIEKLRGDGLSWEKVAKAIEGAGHPTASGKGSWRGASAKKFYSRMTA